MNAVRSYRLLACSLLALTFSIPIHAAESVTAPMTQIFAVRGGTALRAVVYRPSTWKQGESRPAVVILNANGWTEGAPDWNEAYAKHYAAKGLIAISAQFRLASGTTTPKHSISDAYDVMRWVRANAQVLSIDPKRVAVHGLSTGGHLALATAQFNGKSQTSPVPNAVILYSPLLDVEKNKRLQELLGPKTQAAELSPLANIRPQLPPTLILQGDVDTVAPFASAQTFCARMQEAGNRCELNKYMYVGHRFTPKGMPDNGKPQPDPRVETAALKRVDEFLSSLGYLSP